MSKRMIPLDWMRGISAIFIVLYHFTTQYENRFGHDPKWPVNFPWGSLAVVIFFMLSGFLTVFQLNEKSDARSYCIKRLFRLYPAYWCCILITTILMSVFMPELAKSPRTIVINAMMLQSFLHVESVDGAYWTLAYELRFYIYIFFVLILKKQKQIGKFLVAWLALSISTFIVPDNGLFHYYRSGLELVFMCSRAAQFAIGGCIAILVKNKNNHLAWVGIGLGVLLQILVGGSGEIIILLLGTVLIFTGVISSERINQRALKCKGPMNVLHKVVSFFASISYPLYLLHQYIGFMIIHKLEEISIGSEAFIFIPFCAVIFLAYLVHHYVEENAAKISRRYLHA